jgi:hypothetical protein
VSYLDDAAWGIENNRHSSFRHGGQPCSFGHLDGPMWWKMAGAVHFWMDGGVTGAKWVFGWAWVVENSHMSFVWGVGWVDGH